MQQITVLESPGFQNLVDNIEECASLFLQNGSIVYRNANFSTEQQLFFLKSLGDVLGWSPNSMNPNSPMYRENHQRYGSSKEERKTKDDIILNWHMEHTDYKNPIVGATWNMHLFTCDTSIGKTAFVDTTQIYDLMPDDWKNFLSNCVEVINKNVLTTQDGKDIYVSKEHEINCIQPHWNLDIPTVRIDLDTPNFMGLKFLDNSTVTNEHIELFKTIKAFVFDQIYSNDEILQIHQWNQGDFAIVDLFRLAHSVYGGFSPEEREFTGYWAYKNIITDQW